MASGGHPEGAALVTRHDQLAGSLARLQRLAASRQAALMESVCSSVTSSRGRHPSAARRHPQLPQAQQQLRAEKEARDDWFKDVLARGQRLLDEERPSSAEERSVAARQVALEQLIDWRCFLRDDKSEKNIKKNVME
ncbi:unnamed protein product [Danaus chrysippus]|uniref:(African queen) hypothetical protein n=1 Tax=Danaus chrysippus TaxID=151541 RepID=A0A8J2R0A2_9NEOP|nr:unnamed protein product [Danaus chrysippus]